MMKRSRFFVGESLLAAGLLFFTQQALAAATITAEKNCVVRIDGESFELGDRLLVVKVSGGQERKIAIVEVRKKVNGTRVLAKKIKGPNACFDFKGASVRPLAKGGASASQGTKGGGGGGSGENAEVSVGIGTILLAQSGLAYPETSLDSSASRLRSLAFRVSGDIYPLGFFLRNMLSNIIGLGFSWGYGSVFPESEVVDVNSNQTAGKLASKISDMKVDLIARFYWLGKDAATEIRPALYVSDSVTHTFRGESSSASQSLTNVSFSGMGFGLKQRLLLSGSIRLNLGLLYGFQLKGEGSSPLGGDKVPMSSVSGYALDFGGDMPLSGFRVGGGFTYSAFSGGIVAESTDSGARKTYPLTDSRIGIFIDGGMAF